MLFLSVESWTIGFARLIIVLWNCIWGIFLIYQGKKSNTKFLFYWGIYTFFNLFTYSGGAVDFLTILITGHNISGNLYILLGLPISNFSGFFGIVVLTGLLAPKFKWYILFNYTLMFVFVELVIFLNPTSSIYLQFPAIPGEEIINDLYGGPIGNFLMFILTLLVFLIGPGFIYKGIRSQGIIRKKYFYFATAILIANAPAIYDAFFDIPIYIVAITMTIQLTAPFFSYLALRKEPEKRKEKVKEEVKITDSMFRIIQRSEQITEEEVAFYREQKICLICRGKVGGFNIFLCTKCEALYHEDCAQRLSESENACWVCNEPIDKQKSTKPFKIDEKTKYGEILEEEKNSIKDKNSSQSER